MTSANDRYAGLCDYVYISAHLDKQGWVVDLRELCGIRGILQQITETPAVVARPSSSCANSVERPVASDCAETARMPAASTSVSDALKTFCTPPKRSTRLRPRLGPKPSVKDSASHCTAKLSPGLDVTTRASATLSPPHRCNWRTLTLAKNAVKVSRHTSLVRLNIEQ
jgi:hypothetical protein